MGSLVPHNRHNIKIVQMRRRNDNLSNDDPPKKRRCTDSVTSSFDLKHGEYLRDITGHQWKLGKAVGVGGFGEIYLTSDNLTKEVKTDSKYVAKVESHKNGPLFVEMNCYLRIAKQDMIDEWKTKKKIKNLGMPHYVASGSHVHKGERYRFLILPKFDKDLEKVLQEKKMLNLKSVLTISLQIMDVLEYIHSKGYIHSDIKASNILLSNKPPKKKQIHSSVRFSNRIKYAVNNPAVNNPVLTHRVHKVGRTVRRLRPKAHINYIDDIPNFKHFEKQILLFHYKEDKKPVSNDQVYLLDYGLACKYLTSEGQHKPYCVDQRKAHAGTILFCSRDAHKGVPSRRSDLESLGYNIIYWLTGNLPWSENADDPEVVDKKKQQAMSDIEYFLRSCFNEHPKFLEDYFKYIQNLQFEEKPDYNYCKRLLKRSLKVNGYQNDSHFDFDNMHRVKLKSRKTKRISENFKARKFIHKISRPPLQSNIPVKPLLRKKEDKKRKNRTNWFEEIIDPEIILKQAREKKNSENHDSNVVANVAELNIDRLNPTYAMIEVYNKCKERGDVSPTYKGDSCIENVNGYTSAMMSVLQKMKKRKELQFEELAVNLNNTTINNTRSGKITNKCIKKRKKKFESPNKSVPRTTKSAPVTRKENFPVRKVKSAMIRTYSLRG